jgi:hypothetical protein
MAVTDDLLALTNVISANDHTGTNVGSGKVLDSVDCGFRDGTLTDLWSPLGNVCQEWDVSGGQPLHDQ